jgi:enoyl-CoA hydratase/carnithine racemase
MIEVLDAIEVDDLAGVLVLTGAGNAFSAGMDLKEFFRDTDDLPYAQQMQARRSCWQWQWRMLMNYSKPTIAMVNGWCFGGAFTPLVACDLAIAAEDAQFGLSEINWGIIPGGNVTRAVVATLNLRDAMYYIMTGAPSTAAKPRRWAWSTTQCRSRSCARARATSPRSCSARTRPSCARQNGGPPCANMPGSYPTSI